jgi:uncharacterized protein (TIGR00299 family) protein
MTRTAYFDLASGASGDMIIAALADAGRRAGIDVQSAVGDALLSLDLGCAVTFVDDERGGLACLRAEVKTDDTTHAPARLREAIASADVPDDPKRRALDGLDALVRAEATVHGIDTDAVHLHELGSADTAADLIGSAVALHALAVTAVHSAPIPLPSGWIGSRHGDLPLPAPATLELLKGSAVRGVDSDTELVTPTAAAILVAHGTVTGVMPELTLETTGTGGGTRNTRRPNICRVLVGTAARPDGARLETTVLLETNIDDQTPESVGYAIETIMRAGALDAWITPVVMKKSRPAFLLSVLVAPADESRITDVVFHNTTTLGIRRRSTSRWTLDRSEVVVRVRGIDVRVKIAMLRDEVVNVAPEFDDCVAASERLGTTVDSVYDEAAAAARRVLREHD